MRVGVYFGDGILITSSIHFLKKRFYLFILERGKEKEKERERNINV